MTSTSVRSPGQRSISWSAHAASSGTRSPLNLAPSANVPKICQISLAILCLSVTLVLLRLSSFLIRFQWETLNIAWRAILWVILSLLMRPQWPIPIPHWSICPGCTYTIVTNFERRGSDLHGSCKYYGYNKKLKPGDDGLCQSRLY